MERIIIIVRDEVGVIASVTRALADREVNIESLDTERAGEQGIITLTTDDTDTALKALAQAGFRATTDDSLVFRLPDEPGALARVAERFKAAGVNIQKPPHPGPPGRAGGGGAQCPRNAPKTGRRRGNCLTRSP